MEGNSNILEGDRESSEIKCIVCNTNISIADSHQFEGNPYCDSCFQTYVSTCTDCGAMFYTDLGIHDDMHSYCPSCRNDYIVCDDCECIVVQDEAYFVRCSAYCRECYEDRYPDCDDDSNSLYDYSYKPYPVFFGSGRYFGVELEIDGGSNRDELVYELLKEVGDLAYFKRDGSLDYGIEIVTHPMSLDYHYNNFPWKEIMGLSRDFGFKSHSADTCGLHIHVNRESLGATEAQQDKTINQILNFFERNWSELVRFSRRTSSTLSQWASRYGRPNIPLDLIKSAKGSGNRYTCVNLCNSKTIEFRIFRGTLKYNTLIATLQLVDRICCIASSLSLDSILDYSWNNFVLDLDIEGHKELIQYLKERRLYVNEPILT